MANIKLLATSKIATAQTVYCIVRRESDGYLLNDADGAFAAAPSDPYVTLTEHATIKGLYEKSESRTAWEPDQYTVYVYDQTGGSPAPVSDTLEDQMSFFAVGDRIVVEFPFQVGKVATDAGNTALSFKTDLASATTNYCNGSFLKFVSGSLINQQRRISGYGGTSKVITVVSAFTGIPADGVEFFVVNQ